MIVVTYLAGGVVALFAAAFLAIVLIASAVLIHALVWTGWMLVKIARELRQAEANEVKAFARDRYKSALKEYWS